MTGNVTGWDSVIGHKDIISYIEHVTKADEAAHAYILSGDHGSGKTMLAKLFSMALQCENQESSPCMTCRSCKQAVDGNQPDIIWVTHSKPNSISVEEIRDQVVNDVVIKPYQGKRKIYIIEDADKMTVQAQNALLKTLEEPPAYVVILLLTVNREKLLPTILSRCVLLKLRSVKSSLIKRYLTESIGVDEHTAEICTAFAQGSVGRAEALAKTPEFQEIVSDMIRLLRYINDMEISEINAAIKEVQKHKIEIADFLDLIAVWYRDVLLFKATGDVDRVIFREELPFLRERSKRSSYEGLETIVEALKKAHIRLNANVNFDLTIELLILTIKEN